MRAAIGTLKPVIGVRAACEAFDYSRASFYRKEGTELSPAAAAVRHVPRALVLAETFCSSRRPTWKAQKA